MTQPIQEPLTQRSISGLQWRTNQLERRPDPNAAVQHQWAHISTDDVGFESDGTEATVDYYSVFISDNGEDVFDYEVEAGAGQFGEDRVHLLMKVGGIYTFSWSLLTSDLDDTNPELKMFDSIDVTTGIGHAYPGVIVNPEVQVVNQWYIADVGADDLAVLRSITIPVRDPPVNDPRRTGVVKFSYTPQPGLQEFWTVRVWVVRHDEIHWTRGFDFEDSTWNYFDGPHST